MYNLVDFVHDEKIRNRKEKKQRSPKIHFISDWCHKIKSAKADKTL
jgi:hypothetical protein